MDPAACMSLAILAAAVAVGAVVLGMCAALMMALRECALRRQLRRIDARAARALDVGPSDRIGKHREFNNDKERNI